jgi:transcription antitermination factor NusG
MPYWSVARTLPQREAFAAERLEAGGFEIFAPKVKTKRALVPLFAGYLFVFIVEQWRAIDSTPGVLKLIRFGDMPAKCPDAEVARLQAQVNRQGFIRLPDGPSKPARRIFAKGAAVRIVGGPLQGVAALHSGMSAAEKEILLIAMLGAQRPVAIAAHLLAPQ